MSSFNSKWHKKSYDEFMNNSLPKLLSKRFPVVSYSVEENKEYFLEMKIVLVNNSSEVEITFENIPCPDKDGLFLINNQKIIVVPTITDSDFLKADVLSVGEQLYDFIKKRVGTAPEESNLDEEYLKAWLPFNTWFEDFFLLSNNAQKLNEQNWFSKAAHFRRIYLQDGEFTKIITNTKGFICPVGSPDRNTDINKEFTLARSAEISDGKLVRLKGEIKPGYTASAIPFMEYDTTMRPLFAVQWMQRWLEPLKKDPPLVVTDFTPDKDAWCGFNLLTAFMSVGSNTFEDGIVLSESAAKKMRFKEFSTEEGDFLTNRHGFIATVTKVMPDNEMPHLKNGTPIDLAISFTGIQTRMHIGMLLEALAGRIAKKKGKPIEIPVYNAPKPNELQKMLKENGFPENGMENLKKSSDGDNFVKDTTIGYLYWGKTDVTADNRFQHTLEEKDHQIFKEFEYYKLLNEGAYNYLSEIINLRLVQNEKSKSLIKEIENNNKVVNSKYSPFYHKIIKNLLYVGIKLYLSKHGLTFKFTSTEPKLTFAKAINHPWLQGETFNSLLINDKNKLFIQVRKDNERLTQLLEKNSPSILIEKSEVRLSKSVNNYFDSLISANDLKIEGKALFTGRAVAAPMEELEIDQAGIPEEMAFKMFRPFLLQKVSADDIDKRTPKAKIELEKLLNENHIILSRPWLWSSKVPVMAFRPVLTKGKTIRTHPILVEVLYCDYMGHHLNISIPLTDKAKSEAKEKLTIKSYLNNNKSLLEVMIPRHEAMLGIAFSSLKKDGLKKVETLIETKFKPVKYLRSSDLLEPVNKYFDKHGIEKGLVMLKKLYKFGTDFTYDLGLSIPAFKNEDLKKYELNENNHKSWEKLNEELKEHIISIEDYENHLHGVQILSAKCGARGNIAQLLMQFGASINYMPTNIDKSVISNGIYSGMSGEEFDRFALEERIHSFDAGTQIPGVEKIFKKSNLLNKNNVISRARNSKYPGIVFAYAALNGEIDPVNDIDTKLFLGIKF